MDFTQVGCEGVGRIQRAQESWHRRVFKSVTNLVFPLKRDSLSFCKVSSCMLVAITEINDTSRFVEPMSCRLPSCLCI